MKFMGTQINEDGKTEWRNNGGCIERRALYHGNEWEDVAGPETPRTSDELREQCVKGGFGYLPPATRKRNKKLAPVKLVV